MTTPDRLKTSKAKATATNPTGVILSWLFPARATEILTPTTTNTTTALAEQSNVVESFAGGCGKDNSPDPQPDAHGDRGDRVVPETLSDSSCRIPSEGDPLLFSPGHHRQEAPNCRTGFHNCITWTRIKVPPVRFLSKIRKVLRNLWRSVSCGFNTKTRRTSPTVSSLAASNQGYAVVESLADATVLETASTQLKTELKISGSTSGMTATTEVTSRSIETKPALTSRMLSTTPSYSKSHPKSHTNVVLPWCDFQKAETSSWRTWLTSYIPFQRASPSFKPPKIAIIGVHGWFPAKMFQKVMGQPTGTSSKFCSQMEEALRLFYKDTFGVDLEEDNVLSIPLVAEGNVVYRVKALYDQLIGSSRPARVAKVDGSQSTAIKGERPSDTKNDGNSQPGSSAAAAANLGIPSCESYRPAALRRAYAERLERLKDAELVFIATHSQGTPVSTMLIEEMVRNGLIEPQNQNVCMLAMAGISHGPFPYLKGHFIVKYFETEPARELFDFGNPDTAVAVRYYESLDYILSRGVKTVFVSSWLDQVVPLYSSAFHGLDHAQVFRAVHIDSRNYDTGDFLVNLVIFAMQVRNHGLNDHDLLIYLSDVVAGSLYSGTQGHSTLYEELDVYKLAIHFALNGGNPDRERHPSRRPVTTGLRFPSAVDGDLVMMSTSPDCLEPQHDQDSARGQGPDHKLTSEACNGKLPSSSSTGGVLASLSLSRIVGTPSAKASSEGPIKGHADTHSTHAPPVPEPEGLDRPEFEASNNSARTGNFADTTKPHERQSSLRWLAQKVYLPYWSSSSPRTSSGLVSSSVDASSGLTGRLHDDMLSQAQPDDASVSSQKSTASAQEPLQHQTPWEDGQDSLSASSRRLKRMASAKNVVLTPSQSSATFWVGDALRVQRFMSPTRLNPYFLPWVMRGLIDDPAITSHPFLGPELQKIIESFPSWNVESSKPRKELKYRLQVLQEIQKAHL